MERRVYINSYASIEGKSEPDYKEFIPDPVARRRMSRIIKMGVASALVALKNGGFDNIDGIITGTGWGCLADTEKFLNSIYENDERLLNPSAFIQSTPNTVGAQIALFLGANCYNVSYVHGGISFESALIDAILKLQEEGSSRLLVGGFDEMSQTKEHILERMGVWRMTKPGEGAHFFVLSNENTGFSVAELGSVTTHQGYSCLSDVVDMDEIIERSDVELNGNFKILYGLENKFSFSDRIKGHIFNYKKLCGEYPTASAFALWYGCEIFKSSEHTDKIIIVTKHLRERLSVIELNKVIK